MRATMAPQAYANKYGRTAERPKGFSNDPAEGPSWSGAPTPFLRKDVIPGTLRLLDAQGRKDLIV
jgi:hypothetical protein